MKFVLIICAIALILLSVSAEAKKRATKDSKDFCRNKVRSDGTQISTGSCSTFIQGDIPSSDNMPSTLIISPENGAELRANKVFTVNLLISNLETGHFSDPEKQYNSFPQQLNSQGLIKGHTHVTIQKFSNEPPNANEFAFFKGLNDKADPNGLLSVDVVSEDGKEGLPSGNYRICTMAGSFSHQPTVMPIAKRGSQDDCIRIRVLDEVKEKGKKPK